MLDKPFISICLTCYNQERYIAQTLKSLADQDYSPLEIVICDDASKDRTDSIIRSWIAETRRNRVDLKIIYQHNEKNIGIAANYDKCFRLATGCLRLTAAGDDWYASNKVSRFYQAWKRSNCMATVIHSGFYEVDCEGKVLRSCPARSAWFALGGTAAYDRRVFDEFPSFSHELDVEDQVFAKRALLLGPEIRIDEPLTYYRVGSGYSTNVTDFAMRDLRYAQSMLRTVVQLKEDLTRAEVEDTRRQLVERYVHHYEIACMALCTLIEGKTLFQRVKAFRVRRRVEYGGKIFMREILFEFHYLLPWNMRPRVYRIFRDLVFFYDHNAVLVEIRRGFRRLFRHGEYARS